MTLAIILLITALVVIYFLFTAYYPSFGGEVSKELQLQYATSPQFDRGKFVNTHRVDLGMGFSETISLARKFFFEKVENGRPENDLAVRKIDAANIADYASPTRFVWFGHSAFLIQMNHKNILLDPMFGDVPAPLPILGGKRFYPELPIEIQSLPQIDAVLISHDHYDHLDYGSISMLKEKVETFYTPLGVGVHLEAWGISKDRIVELDWWQETTLGELQFVCTPARHFSGRKFSNGQSTLWSSWVIRSTAETIYFSGDSGYDGHFKEIGDKYGPFDFAMIECGQYNELWPDIHMFPEESVQAGIDLKANRIMPIHWGAFKLALHSWTDPVQRVTKKAKALKVPIITPQIGDAFLLKEAHIENQDWWH